MCTYPTSDTLIFFLALAIVTHDLAIVWNIFSTFRSFRIIFDLDDSEFELSTVFLTDWKVRKSSTKFTLLFVYLELW